MSKNSIWLTDLTRLLSLLKYEPYVISRSLIAVASAFNKFYYEQRIMADDPKVQAARLALAEATRLVLKNGLNLLGISAPERM